MVSFISLFVLLFTGLISAANLELELSSTHVEMGKYITATFTYKGNVKPDLIDLDLWHDDFYIEQADADLTSLSAEIMVSTTKARLYPRHIGNITLDAIALGGSFIKPIHIKVTPSIRNNVDATPIVSPIKNNFWADEVIQISINAPLHVARNVVIAKEWLIDGFNITQLPSITTKKNVLLKWLIYTPNKGKYSLELPAIVQRGRGRFRFYLPKINFTIKPLPAYLPSSIASGTLSISSKIISNGTLKIAQITLQKRGYFPQNIEGFQTFINTLNTDELALGIQSEDNHEHGITTRTLKLTLPEWLWNDELSLKLMFFNTQTGRLDSVKHKLPKVNTIPKSVQHGFIFLCVLAGLFILGIINKIFNQWRLHQQLKHCIRQARNAKKLRLIILNNGQFKTLDDWASQTRTADANKVRDLLNQACYQRPKNFNLNDIKHLLLNPK